MSLLNIHALFHSGAVYFGAGEDEKGLSGLRCDCFVFFLFFSLAATPAGELVVCACVGAGVSLLSRRRPFLSSAIKTQSRTDSLLTRSHLSVRFRPASEETRVTGEELLRGSREETTDINQRRRASWRRHRSVPPLRDRKRPAWRLK